MEYLQIRPIPIPNIHFHRVLNYKFGLEKLLTFCHGNFYQYGPIDHFTFCLNRVEPPETFRTFRISGKVCEVHTSFVEISINTVLFFIYSLLWSVSLSSW